ncbi:GNAT family N-acetyltransferase [Leucobacter viscericola]|uniref:GNAT family N-acetyltransferase n=1 Tax=Leucobacter viscericola TaxID=2714935 RepID=A0A6G7XDH3_9MICO|nr:GNAT family N-acetyltransferase [Leucobacter viscericola]QIK62615.1 GNAT family N-acetyltransferase [Leucobacter viscericola]
MSRDLLAGLPETLQDGNVRLQRIDNRFDASALFEVLGENVWEHIPGGRPADPGALKSWMLAKIDRDPSCATWLVFLDGAVVGTTSHFGVAERDSALEIGASYMGQTTWGTGLNARVKTLMINAARVSGAEWVLFQTDERNARSAQAILKLGAQPCGSRVESIVRKDGSRRTSVLFELKL